MNKTQRLFTSYWGDLVLIIALPTFFLLSHRELGGVMPYARFLFGKNTLLALVAFARLVFLKERIFRDWLYLGYFVLPLVCLAVYVFPIYDNNDISYYYKSRYFSLTLLLMGQIIGISNGYRLGKWFKKWNDKPPTEDVIQNPETSDVVIDEHKAEP